MDAADVEPAIDASGGEYTPPSRKDLMLDIRRSDEAEGDTRMIGSTRREDDLGFIARDGLWARPAAAGCCDFLAMNGAANFRT
jgi:hypothetical protein